MPVLIVYATSHGSTREIAERVGAVLAEHGIAADVRPVEDPGRLEGHEAFVIGSAVHDQAWLPRALDFVRDNAPALRDRPVWLFSVGMPGAFRGPLGRLMMSEGPRLAAQFDGVVEPVGHRLFSGVVARSHLPAKGRFLFKIMGGRYGDRRDWPGIDAWSEEIARRLETGPAHDSPE
jgi:menaquinone-dependent protoporphyrinogen oxidase